MKRLGVTILVFGIIGCATFKKERGRSEQRASVGINLSVQAGGAAGPTGTPISLTEWTLKAQCSGKGQFEIKNDSQDPLFLGDKCDFRMMEFTTDGVKYTRAIGDVVWDREKDRNYFLGAGAAGRWVYVQKSFSEIKSTAENKIELLLDVVHTGAEHIESLRQAKSALNVSISTMPVPDFEIDSAKVTREKITDPIIYTLHLACVKNPAKDECNTYPFSKVEAVAVARSQFHAKNEPSNSELRELFSHPPAGGATMEPGEPRSLDKMDKLTCTKKDETEGDTDCLRTEIKITGHAHEYFLILRGEKEGNHAYKILKFAIDKKSLTQPLAK